MCPVDDLPFLLPTGIFSGGLVDDGLVSFMIDRYSMTHSRPNFEAATIGTSSISFRVLRMC